ncbi:MAG: hypothetical protein DMF61_01595 [Blastocatellia bacterium AA13]|nr:MAG: hypothetical protein DMF61_01595 [Blastocatellia bacterium AA13]
MSTSKNVIRVPKPPADAFNKDRPVPQHLRTQMEHLADTVRKLVRDEIKAAKTEGEAAVYIKKMTEIVRLFSGNQ